MKRLLLQPDKAFKRYTALFVAFAAIASSAVWGQTTWTAGTGDWFTAGNWSAGIPVSAASAKINNGGTIQISAAGAVAQNILVSSATGGGGTLEISGAGTLTTVQGEVGADTGVGTVRMSGGIWNNTAFLRLGTFGDAVFDLTGGVVSSDRQVIMAQFAGSSAVLNIGTGTTAGVLDTVSLGGLTAGPATINFNHNQADYFFTRDGTATGGGNIIEDSIAVNQIGSGKTTLTGNNVNTGGTTISAGTLQVGAGGTTGSLGTGNVTNNSHLIFNRSDAFTFGNVISGTGSVEQAGTGTTTLTGNNTYSGGTTVSGGTLSLGSNTAAGTGTITTTGSVIDYANGVTISNPININSNTTQLQVTTGSATQSGVISETGGARPLEKIGAGTLVLSADNTYTGTTTVTAGTLDVTGNIDSSVVTVENGAGLQVDGSSLADAAAVTLNGTGNLTLTGSETIGSLAGAGAGTVILGANTLTTGGNNTTTSFAGVISGTGGLTKTGTGTLTLTGANTYSGGTTFSAGTLSVGSNANLGAAAGGLIFDGGTLQNTASFTSNRATTLNAGGGTFSVDAGTTLTQSGQVSGTGTLTKTGAGTLTLSAINNTGGSIVSDGTLRLLNSAIFVGNITNNATVEVNVTAANVGFFYNSVMSGTGSLVKTGAGSVVLTQANTYSGATTVAAGILAVTGNIDSTVVTVENGAGLRVDGSSLADAAAVTLNGTGNLMLTGSETIGSLAGAGAGTVTLGANTLTTGGNNTTTSFAGVISGAGGLTKTGTDTFTLSGANTYTGGTTISAGTLQIGNSGTTGSITGNVTNNGMLIFNRSDALTFGGVISGTGGLNKLGSNVLTLIGANTYTGATNVNAGTLLVNGSLGNTAVAVNNGAILGGSGTIAGAVTVNNGGTLAPGNSPGILTVGALTLNTGSTTQFEINGTTPGTGHDQIVVAGNAQLGGTAELSFGFTPSNGDTFTLIDAATITGNFDSVVNSLGNALIFTTSITDDYVLSITAVQTSFATSGFTGDDPDLIAIAMVLDNNFSDPDLLPVINALNGLPGTSLEGALQLINPDELTALSGVSFANTRSAILRLGNRLRSLRNGASGIDTSGFSLFDQSGQFRSKSLLADTSTVAPTGLQIMEPAVHHDPRLGVFISGSGTFGDYDGDVNGAGYDYDAAAVLGGADYRVTDTAAVGFYAGYDRTDLNLGNNGGTVDADTVRFGVTGTWWAPQVLSEKHDLDGTTYVEAHAGGAHHWYQTDRNAFGGVASGDTTAAELSAGGTLGYEFRKGNLTFGPEASLNYLHLWTDGFTETGSLAPITTNNDTSGSLYSTVGGRASYQLEIQGLQISPYVHAGWRHEYLGTTESVAARFASGAGGIFNVIGSSAARDSIVAGAGVSGILNEWLSAELSYNGEGSADTEIHSINGSVTARF